MLIERFPRFSLEWKEKCGIWDEEVLAEVRGSFASF